MAKIISLNTHPDFNPEEKKPAAGRKPKGMRKDGRIKRTFTDGTRPDGTPNVKCFYGKTVAEAEAARDAYKTRVKTGIDMARQKMTVAEWLEEWRVTYKSALGDSSKRALKSYIKRINRHVGDMYVVNVRNSDLQAVLNEMEGYARSTVSVVRQTLFRAFKRAVTNQIILYNPADDLVFPELADEEPHRALEPWESEMVLKHWRLHWFGRYVKFIMLCGARPGEAVAMSWNNIDMRKRTISIKDAAELTRNAPRNRGKTKTPAGIRIVPICDELFNMLDETPDTERSGYVFLSAHRRQLSASALDRGLESYLNVMGRVLNGDDPARQTGRPHKRDLSRAKDEVQREKWAAKNKAVDEWVATRKKLAFTLYDLRHTFCTAMYDADVDVKTAAYFMGHKNVETTLRIYTHLTDEKRKQGAAKMITFLNEWKVLPKDER